MPREVSKSGFTLVELLIAIVASAIIALTAGTMIFFFFKAWRVENAAVEVQRDGTVTTEFLARKLRAASLDNILISSQQIDILGTSGTNRFYVSENDFLFDPNPAAAGDEIVLVSGQLTSFTPAKNSQNISYQLVIDNGDEVTDIRSTIKPRN